MKRGYETIDIATSGFNIPCVFDEEGIKTIGDRAKRARNELCKLIESGWDIIFVEDTKVASNYDYKTYHLIK